MVCFPCQAHWWFGHAAHLKIARVILTIRLDRNWSSFQLANSTPPLSVTGSALAPSARMAFKLASSQFVSAQAERGQILAAASKAQCIGSSSQAVRLIRNFAMDDSIGGS